MVWMRAAPSPWGRTSQQLAPDDREQYDERGRDALRQGPKAGHQTTHHRSGRATLQTDGIDGAGVAAVMSGCPSAALLDEIARRPAATRQIFTDELMGVIDDIA